jgi:site-specific DNA-adenine methylase
VTLRAPFPWFGGKSRVASIVWERFGDVSNYVEPFAGSLAVLLARPTAPRVESVNDRDAYLCNFWRALQADPEAVARYANWPVNETDLHARHRWLVETGRERVERLVNDAEFYDAKVAGWWVWGLCAWIGSGWCTRLEWKGRIHAGAKARGIQAIEKKRPQLDRGGRGVHSTTRKMPMMTGHGGGVGVHRPGLHGQMPDLSGTNGAGRGLHGKLRFNPEALTDYLVRLSERLRPVRVTCGDWSRLTGPAVTTCVGLTGMFLDPPYAHAERDRALYSEDHDISGDVRTWAVENGNDPRMRIALCGYEGEHEMPESWACVPWKAPGGYGARTVRGRANALRERIWFSPHCLSPDIDQHDLEISHG